MGQQQSKGELLYQQVNDGNIDGIKALHSEGAGLEWMDREGKTPLIVACMNPQPHNVANTLIELGANVNAYRPGRHAGTPLHHAAKRGLEQTVKLLLSHGANPLVINDDCQTPLDVARAKGYNNVVRAIESDICLFSGWLLELYGPGFLELFAPQLLSRKVWVVVLPCGSRNLRKPFKLELAVYASAQDAQPRMIVALWKANMEEPKFNQPDPAVIITYSSTIPRRWRRKRGIVSSREGRCRPRGARQTRIKLAAANENDKQQLQAFCNACKGIPQVVHTTFPFNAEVPVVPSLPATAPPALPEDVELAMAINASLQSAAQEIQPHVDTFQGSGAAASTSSTGSFTGISDSHPGASTPQMGSSSKCQVQEANSSGSSVQHIHTSDGKNPSVVQANANPVSVSAPSAPPVSAAPIDDGPIHYPAIDTSPVDLSSPTVETLPAGVGGGKEDGTASSSCVVCLDAPAEGVCVPCGHMAGCLSCLNEIKAKKWGCPVCRAKIDQVIRVYAV